jgi:hypothetical protein
MNELVSRLSQGEHPLEASVRPKKTVEEFKEAIDRGYVHIRFTATRGGTELGFNVDEKLSDFRSADFKTGKGRLKICGDLTLDCERVRCVAEIDLATLDGTGHLELLGKQSAC